MGMSDKENTMAAQWGLGGDNSYMESSRRQAWSFGAWVLLTDRQTTRMGTPEVIVGWEKTQLGTPARGLARTGLFRMGNGGSMCWQ